MPAFPGRVLLLSPVLGGAFSSSVAVVEGKGHMLGVDYAGPLLDRWCAKS
jgi:hypothetical protein